MKIIKLFWEGLWDITDFKGPFNIPETGGILMYIDAQYTANKIGFDTESYRLVTLQGAMNMQAALGIYNAHITSWKNLSFKRPQNRLLLKICKIESDIDRMEVMHTLIQSAQSQSDVRVFNSGYKSPLKSEYISKADNSLAYDPA